jgi:hypothetical protein
MRAAHALGAMSPLQQLSPVEEHLGVAIIALTAAISGDHALSRCPETRRLAELLTNAQRQLGDLKHALRMDERVQLCVPSDSLPGRSRPGSV